MPASPQEHLADFAAALRPRLTGDLRLDPVARALYATDASMYQVEPVGVVVPRHADDVQAAAEEAGRFGLPVLPRGSGSSLAGSAVGAALVIDTTRWLDGITRFDAEAKTVTVQPGVVLDRLNAALARRGLRFGPDPASSNRATLGGMVGTNATGTHSIRYGSVVDHVISAKAVLPDGTAVAFGELDEAGWTQKLRASGSEGRVYRALDALLARERETIERDTPKHWRRAGGYRLERLLDRAHRNPAHLLCGSEGTLAFVTEITLGLVERPVRTALGVAHFESRRAALEAVEPILETDPAAVELFDRIALHRARAVEEYRPKLHFVQGDPAALLIVEYEGATEAELAAGLDRLRKTLGPNAVFSRCLLDAEIRDVWGVRKVGLDLAMSARRTEQPLAFIEDAAVPVRHLPDYITRLEGVLEEHGTEAVVYAHASAGCLHVRPFLDIKREEGVRDMAAIAQASADLVKEYGGIVASEHGDGLARSWLAEGFYGRALYDCYREAKRAFDPEGRFNPGRIVEAPPMTENLRYGPDYRAPEPPTALDWSASGGFAAAVERCNGSGVCRKRDAGTMCPSFMVTREERDSTRGRANALRHVLSGQLPPEAMASPAMADVMDLCISCKACQSECPAQVDMARMKAEWQARYWEEHPMPTRTKLFAYLPRFSRRFAGPLAPAVNAANRLGVVRRQMEKRFGIAASRALPPFARRPFDPPPASPPIATLRGGEAVPLQKGDSRARPEAKPTQARRGVRVVLYADTFARYHEPEIPRAAVAVLEAAGFEVVVPPYRCCGRTAISKGVLDRARSLAAQLVEALHPFAAEGLPIVGLEPSCILTLRDELPALAPNDPRVEAVGAAAVTFEEFVARERAAFERLPWPAGDGALRPVLLHAHCHQKALSGVAPSVSCLETAGFAVDPLDAGCCGMAGSFGYEAEHLAVSVAMAERVLAPAVRSAPEEAAISAAGTSCRHQIADLTGRRAEHPAVLLAEALGLA